MGHYENAIIKVFGQDYNPRSYAVAASDLLIKGHKDSRIEFGNTLTDSLFDQIKGFRLPPGHSTVLCGLEG